MKYYIVDAFTDAIFKGNLAGVCLPDIELDTGTMQQIAAENNLPDKEKMVAMQLSKRGGTLFCEDCGDWVKIAGKAALYLRGGNFSIGAYIRSRRKGENDGV